MDQAKLPGSKVLEDRFMVIEQAMGMPGGATRASRTRRSSSRT